MSRHFPGPVKEASSVRLDLLTWPEVEEYLNSCKAIILPIGSTEQHGPTGAIGTDAITAQAVAIQIGLLTGVLVAPTQFFGMAEHHLGFPGTMSVKPSTYMALIHDLLISLLKHGFERVFVVNGHGGNVATVKSAFMQAYSTANYLNLPASSSFRCKLVNWYMADSVFHLRTKLYGKKEGQHATPSEIALTLYVEPSLRKKQRPLPPSCPSGPIYGEVDFRQRYPDGRMGSDPFLAKPEHGETLLAKAAYNLSEELIAFIEAT